MKYVILEQELERIKDIFNKVKTSYKELFDINEKIQLDSGSIRYVVGELQKKNNIPQNYDIFMGVAYYCGHNRRGEKIDRDDMPLIIDAYRKWMNNEVIGNTKNYFTANINDLLNTGF